MTIQRVQIEGFIPKCSRERESKWHNYHNGEQVVDKRCLSPTIIATYHKQFFKIVDDR